MASGYLGYLEYKLNIAIQGLRRVIHGSHPNTFVSHPQWVMDRQLLKFSREALGEVPEDAVILDFGCGNGPYWGLRPDLIWYGADIIENERTSFIINSDGRLQAKDSLFDAILCTQVIEHVTNLDVCFSEIFRLLKPGGILILNAPFLYPYHGLPHDYRRLTLNEAIKLLADYDVVRKGHIGAFGSVIATLFNNFINDSLNKSFTLRILGVVLLPVTTLINMTLNLLSVPLDSLDKTDSYPLNFFIIAAKPVRE